MEGNMNAKFPNPKDIQQEVLGWLDYLNDVVGVMCFTLGMAALGTRSPAIFAAISMGFVLAFHVPNKKKAKRLAELSRKKDRTELENVILNDIRSKLRWQDSLSLIYGYTFLSFIIAGHFLFKNFPALIEMLYG